MRKILFREKLSLEYTSLLTKEQAMAKAVKRVAVTGGSGQIAYSLLFRIASGELFGNDQPVALHILEIPQALEALKGVQMELDDCAFPLLKEIKIGSEPLEIFAEADVAILVGSKPRSKGEERKDLLEANGKIFVEQGKALNKVASKEVCVFVVGNPCNTNCLIARHHAPDLRDDQFFAMTRLDQNRAMAQLAKKAGVDLTAVDQVAIWGNHSATQVPDFVHATIEGKPVADVITDRPWLESTFFETVQKRGAAIIAARGKSSAASAANAVIDSLRSILHVSSTWHSVAVSSNQNPYGIKENLIFSFPCTTVSEKKIEIVADLQWDSFLKEKIAQTEKELLDERDLISHLLK